MSIDLKAPNRPKALQYYLRNNQELNVDRVGFLKVEQGNWPAIVFNEGNWSSIQASNIWFEKGVDIFPILIDVVVSYEEYKKGYELRGTIRKLIGKFNGSLTDDREGTIAFRQFLAPVYDKETNNIVFGSIYLLKQNYDYTEPEPTPTLDNSNENDVNDTSEELTEQGNSGN